MMGADLGHLCALQHGDGTVNRPTDTGGSAIVGVQQKTIGVRDSSP